MKYNFWTNIFLLNCVINTILVIICGIIWLCSGNLTNCTLALKTSIDIMMFVILLNLLFGFRKSSQL